MAYTPAYEIGYVTIMQPTTEISTSESFSITNNNTATLTLSGTLSGEETVTLYVYDPIASIANNIDTFIICPNSILFTASSDPTIDGFAGCGRYQLVKSATLNSVGISLVQNINTQTILL